MGRYIGTFLDLEEIVELLNNANKEFDKPFAEFMYASGCTHQRFNAHVSMGTKKLPSVVYTVYNLGGRYFVTCDNNNFAYNCNVLKEHVERFMEQKKEKQ